MVTKTAGVEIMRPLSPDEEDRAWMIYERGGSMAAAARDLGLGYHRVRQLFLRDPIRMAHVNACRAEELASKWEDVEEKSTTALNTSVDVIVAMLKHIHDCAKAGQSTDLIHPDGAMAGIAMTPTAAYQWMMKNRVFDSIDKIAYSAAKASEVRRAMVNEALMSRGAGSTKDPTKMTDDELRTLVSELEGHGVKLPWGQMRPNGAGTSS